MQLDSRSDLQQMKMDYQEKFNDAKNEFTSRLRDIQQQNADTKVKSESDRADYQSQLIGVKQNALDNAASAAQARIDAANARLQATQSQNDAKNARADQNQSDREDNANQKQIDIATTEADKDAAAIGKISDPTQKAAAYTKLGIDPNDPNADQLLSDAALQSRLGNLPKKAQTYA